MITLYTFGPAFGLPDPSPFVTKAEVLLEMSGLPYRCDTGGFGKAPKGKLPYIDDDGTVVADSTLIRFHLEDRHKIDFDKGLSPADKGIAWACEKLTEDHLYWAVVRERWMDPENFKRGPARFFDKAPALIRPLVVAMIGRQVRRNLHGQGMGRYTLEEMSRLTARGIDSLAALEKWQHSEAMNQESGVGNQPDVQGRMSQWQDHEKVQSSKLFATDHSPTHHSPTQQSTPQTTPACA